ncbi:MAG: hypothetical protein JRI75_08535 [Deltaproteobacteria bacterium]|nr:hypothetical protein [Deltaproteobacteria bacterium]
MRLLIFLGLIYLGYRAVKSWLFQNSTPKPVFDTVGTDMDDLMVRDPFCEVYFPKRDGMHLKVNGEDLYFCSNECRDGFIASHVTK